MAIIKNTARKLDVTVVKPENPRNALGFFTRDLSGLKPNNMHLYFDISRKGCNVWKGYAFEASAQRDTKIGAAVMTRKFGAAKKEWSFSYGNDSSLSQARQDEILKFCKDNLDKPEMVKVIADMIEAQIQGITYQEIIWKVSKSQWWIDEIKKVQNSMLLFDDKADEYLILEPSKLNIQELRTLNTQAVDRIDVGKLAMEPMDPLKILITKSFDGNSHNAFLNGCQDSLIWAYLFKNYGLKDWSIYVERFSNPSIIATLPPLISDPDRAIVEKAVQKFGNLWRGVFPNGVDVKFQGDEQKQASKELFKEYIDYWDTAISIRVLGQNLTTSIKENGSRAAAETHNQVREDLQLVDMLLAKITMSKLIRRLVDINYGEDVEAPKWGFVEEQNVEYQEALSRVILNLRQAGWKVTSEIIKEKFGVDVSEVEVSSQNNNINNSMQNSDANSNDYIELFIKEVFNGLQQ